MYSLLISQWDKITARTKFCKGEIGTFFFCVFQAILHTKKKSKGVQGAELKVTKNDHYDLY